tara:strand:- start:1372 stop:1650 length:279 start_codon:yes stop_codon:yes gene_type:complete
LNSKPLPDAVREDYPDVSSTESPESSVPCPNPALFIILALSQSNSASNAFALVLPFFEFNSKTIHTCILFLWLRYEAIKLRRYITITYGSST